MSDWQHCDACGEDQMWIDGACWECTRQKMPHLTWRQIADAIYAMEAEGHEIDGRAFIDDGNTQGYLLDFTMDVYTCGGPHPVTGEHGSWTEIEMPTLNFIMPHEIRKENLPEDPPDWNYFFDGVLEP